ncbi:MAG: DMT family transporter [Chlorobi bacterium]|nr:DMT family transporter [Chlorobiota bacterium]
MNNPSEKFHQKYKGELILLLITLLWSATFVIVKESLNNISSMLFVGFRFLIAGIILLPVILRKKVRFKNVNLKLPIILGILLFLGFATQTIGLRFTSATKSAFLTGSAVIIIPILQTIIEKKKPKSGAVIGVVIVLIGILLLSGGNSFFTLLEDLVANFNFGDGMTLLCALFFALYVVYLDVLSNQYNFWLLLMIQIIVTTVLAFMFAVIFDIIDFEIIKINFTSQLGFGIIYTAIFATLVTTALQTKYQNLVTPTKAGIVYSFEPIFAAIIAYLAIGERITTFGFIGAALIFIGLIISEIFDEFKNLRKSV